MLTNEELMAINGYSEDDLEHYGILGMKWGIRRYENPDGSLTEAGKRRYAKYERKKQRVMQSGDAKKILKFRKNLTDEEFDTAMARVAKTDALRYNANAAKREKQEARAAEKAEKQFKKEAKKAEKLNKEQVKKAEQIAKENAKKDVKSKDFMTVLTKAAAVTGTILTLYRNVTGIGEALGFDMPKLGGNKDKKQDNKDNSNNNQQKTQKQDNSNNNQQQTQQQNNNQKQQQTQQNNNSSFDWDSFVKSAYNTYNKFKSTQSSSPRQSVSPGVSVEGVGNSFKRESNTHFDFDFGKAKTATENIVKDVGRSFASGLSSSSIQIGQNQTQPYLALPYDPNKKF